VKGRRGLGVWILLTAALAACWFLFAPRQLGGSTIYSSTVGNSMEPLLHKGDLALIRPSSHYRVHEIVLYESPVLHRPVLHRIIAIDDGRYFFKGDHNDFIDPGSATRSELLGRLWFHVPRAGSAMSFIGAPSHAAIIAGLAALLVALAGAGRAHRRRRRPVGGGSPVKAAIRNIHKPRHPFEELGTVALLAATVLAAVVGFTTPAKKAVALPDAYRQTGAFSYSATVTRGSASVLGSTVTTGQPVFLSQAKVVDFVFRYHFASPLPHGVRGTIGLSAGLSSESSSWHHRYVIAPTRSFRGDDATIRASLSLTSLLQVLNSLAVASGNPADQYEADITPTVTIRGYVNGKPVATTFAPTLPFAVTKALVKLDVSTSGPLPGQTTAPLSPEAATAKALAPSASGSIPGVGPNSVTVARTRLSVVDLRGIALGLVGLLALVVLTRPIRRHREAMPAEERMASDAGCVIVDVVSLAGGAAFTGEPVRLPDFASVVGFARYLERPILHDLDSGSYAAEDGGRLYVFVPTPETTPAPRPHGAAAPRPPTAHRRRHSLRWLGAGLLLLAAVGVTATFTAANTVPLSKAGVSTFPKAISDLAPSQCSGLTLTNLVVASGSTTTGTSANDLILGRSGTGILDLNGGGGNDCIVAGGGSGTVNVINGSSGGDDVCIGAPGAINLFSNCEHTYQ
jgi:signal peptidase I